MRRLAVLLALCAGGCTFEAGAWFATLHPSFRAGYGLRADRDAGAGWQRLDNDYQVRFDRALLDLQALALEEPPLSSAFDPAHPPPGYTTCHSGHCHASDGRLVSYEDIAVEVAGPGVVARAVAHLPVGAVDLLTPTTRDASRAATVGVVVEEEAYEH